MTRKITADSSEAPARTPTRPRRLNRFAMTGLGLCAAVSAACPTMTTPLKAQAWPDAMQEVAFQIGTWRVEGRRADGQGGWQEYTAWLRVEPTSVGGWWGLSDSWSTTPAGWHHETDLGATLRFWDSQEEMWFSRIRYVPTIDGWSWPPFIWPERVDWVATENGLAMPARLHDDVISNHADTAGVELREDGSWSMWAARRDEGTSQFYVWESLTAWPVDLSRGAMAAWPERRDGRVETLWDGVSGSRGLAMDDLGNVYIAGVPTGAADDHIPIIKVTPAGERSVFATGLGKPSGLSWSGNHLYAKAHDVEGGRLVRINRDGTIESLSNVPGDLLATDHHGNAYTLHAASGRMMKTTPSGDVSVFVEDDRLIGTLGSAFHAPTETIFVTHFSDGRVIAIDLKGEVRLHAQLDGMRIGASAWVAATDDWLWVTGFGLDQVFRVSVADGRIEWVAGSGLPGRRDGPVAEARFRAPNGIAVTPDGRTVWVADLGDVRDGIYPNGALRRILLDPEHADGASDPAGEGGGGGR